jgi:hypothetical protein
MNKGLYATNQYLSVSFNITVIKILQIFPLYQWHHITFHDKKRHTIEHCNEYVESIII